MTAAITSPANPRLKAVAALRDRRARDRIGQLLVDGAREIVRALDGGVTIIEAFMVEPMPPDEELAAAAGRLVAAGIPVTMVAAAALRRIAYGDRASGIVAVAAAPDASLAALEARLSRGGPADLVAVVEDVEKPGNLGAVCRSADGAGFDALIAASSAGRSAGAGPASRTSPAAGAGPASRTSPAAGAGPASRTSPAAGADPWNPNAVRASVGTIFSLPVATGSTADVLAFVRARGLQIIAARVDGAVAYTAVDLARPSALVLGSEADGLTGAWHAADVIGVRLPMRGRADSLNVAAAAAILFYEARRQRDARSR